MATKTKKELSFEDAMARLEDTVHALESGELPLDKSLAVFEEGIGLIRLCNEKLAEAEQKVKLLTQSEDGATEENFPLSAKEG